MAFFAPNTEITIIERRLRRGNLQFIHGAGAPTDAVTGAGTLKKAGCYLNTSNDAVYVNVGSKAAPRYTLLNHV